MSKTILIVEDNPFNMKLLNDVLQAEKFGTVCATSGEEALVLVQESKPDFILMDLRLPGITGLETAREIRRDSKLADVPMVAVTAYAMQGNEREILAAGCNGCIEKPFSIQTLLTTIGGFLNSPASS